MADKVRLNIGAGGTTIPGFIPLDIKAGQDARKLDYADESVDEIYASHVLEHIPHTQTMAVLGEWYRVLKPGGRVRIAVPDFPKLVGHLQSPAAAFAEAAIFGSHSDGDDIHHALFDKDKLVRQLYSLGFHQAGTFTPFVNDCSRYDISLNIEAFKRAYTIPATARFCWIISEPRIGFTDHKRCMASAAKEFGGETMQYYSAFWEKGMTIGVESALKESSADYFIFSDFDSVFCAEDLRKLAAALQDDKYAGAAVAWQMSRHHDEPLVFDPDVKYEGERTRVKFSHFGLTMIRRAVFEELPKPWFLSVPDANGEWGKSNAESDADISFWRIMAEHGIPVIQCNDVVIGHMDLTVRWPHPEGVQHQPIRHYWKYGRPKSATVDPKVYAERRARAQAPAQKSEQPPTGA